MTFLIIVILFLISTIMIHEFGHYKIGMLVGIKPTEVGLGFGPKIYKKKLKNYDFAIKLFPLGGYVAYGDSMFTEKEYYEAAPWKRMLISLAGPLMNILYAFLILLGIEVYGQIKDSGFSFVTLINSIIHAGQYTYTVGTQVVTSTVNYFANDVATPQQLVKSISGPVGAYKVLLMYQSHPEYLAIVFAALNMALFWFNMIPFPALDGCGVFTSLTEMIVRKKINIKAITIINFIGFVIIFVVSIIILFWDLISKVLLKIL